MSRPAASGHLALRFGLAAGLWTLASFAILRTPFAETCLLLPLTRFQAQAAAWYSGGPVAPIAVTLSCSGGDVMALCLAMTLAYPVAWVKRLWGAALGVIWILGWNTLRIGVLGLVAGSSLFGPLHLYVWPAALIVLTLAYLGAWIWFADQGVRPNTRSQASPWLRFAVTAVACVTLFMLASPWLLRSSWLLAAAAGVGRVAAALLRGAGADVTVANSVISTRHGSFIVTPECITTPLMPLYVAAALSLPLSSWQRGAALLAFAPLFAALAVARLLTVALPPILVTSPLFLTHAFYQLLVAFVLILAASWWGKGFRNSGRAARLAVSATVLTAGLLMAGGLAYTNAVVSSAEAVASLGPHTLTRLTGPTDSQGALLLFPAFQAGLFIALSLALAGRAAAKSLLPGMALIYLSQLAFLVAAGELGARTGFSPSVILVRAWTIAGAVLVVALLRRLGSLRSNTPRATRLPPASA
jgi:exosortase/archaeosortase family protein